MIIVLGDLIADISFRIQQFPITAGSMQRMDHLDIGPGGAGNVAIVASRLGLPTTCLGEVGGDRFGGIVLDGLKAEGIDTSHMIVTPNLTTPVAGVFVDPDAEPAYLGFPGTLQIDHLPTPWRRLIQKAEALFVEGWIDHEGGKDLILEALRLAKASGIPTFFDPGPGNPSMDNGWHIAALSLSTAVVATQAQASHLCGEGEIPSILKAIHNRGPSLVILKRGSAGCVLSDTEGVWSSPGFSVSAVDATGAGDSFNAAIILAYLHGLSLSQMGLLANAIGAAKVEKIGTGHHMPSLQDVHEILRRFEVDEPALEEILGSELKPAR